VRNFITEKVLSTQIKRIAECCQLVGKKIEQAQAHQINNTIVISTPEKQCIQEKIDRIYLYSGYY
jgi:hypothetical protein